MDTSIYTQVTHLNRPHWVTGQAKFFWIPMSYSLLLIDYEIFPLAKTKQTDPVFWLDDHLEHHRLLAIPQLAQLPRNWVDDLHTDQRAHAHVSSQEPISRYNGAAPAL